MPDEQPAGKPTKLSSYSLLSPLYLNQRPAPMINNAKILATHLVAIDDDQYQTLHVIDQPLEFAYVNKRTQLPGANSLLQQRRTTQQKRALSLDDALGQQQGAETLHEFYERFADLHSAQPDADQLHARAFAGSSSQRVQVTRDQLSSCRVHLHVHTWEREEVGGKKLATICRSFASAWPVCIPWPTLPCCAQSAVGKKLV